MSETVIPPMEGPVCPIPRKEYDSILIGHGSGGRMTQDLIRDLFHKYFSNPTLLAGNDFAEIPMNHGCRLAISTDAHIVSPVIFPGGDIGRLAVSGTVNDISMSGGTPLALTASFILEEGLPITLLEKIVASMADTAAEAGIPIVAGDTKVVEKGKGDGIFISTTGIALISDNSRIGGECAVPGDAVLISGSIGDHGIAVLSARGDLGLELNVASDVAPLNAMIAELVENLNTIHVLRDPTRGGLATTLNEIAQQSNVNVTIDEDLILVKPVVRSACELIGFDPLYLANEGKVVVILPQPDADNALKLMRSSKYGSEAKQIGHVNSEPAPRVLLKTSFGGTRLLDIMTGEMLPRIC